jgi:anti-anti-sigma factor
VPADGIATLVAPAEIDLSTSDSFAQLLDGVDRTRPLIVDCSQVRFIDSSGLRVLVVARQDRVQAGGSLTVANPPESMLRLLEITGLLHLVDGG